jgi:thiamine-monophosphate kinase
MHEFDIIKKYFQNKLFPNRKDIILGSGDDCALLKPPKNELLAVSIDTLIEGVHFHKNFDPREVGYKSLAVNLSDLAAMGATPAWFTCALSLTNAQKKTAWLKNFTRGLKEAAHQYNISLVGGDLTKSKLLSITIQVHGFVPPQTALQRNQAKAGDYIYVSGKLGRPILSNYTSRPHPRIQLGLALRGKSTCAIDISDGLIADLSHLLKASRVGASLYLDKIPLVHPDGLYAGDDYELCFTGPKNLILKNIDCEYSCIGKIEKKMGLKIYYSEHNKKLYTIKKSGYQHF